MKQFSYDRALLLAFSSGELYRDVAKNWPGVAALYMGLLTLVLTLPTFLGIMFLYFPASDTREAYVKQLPGFSVKQGKLTIDAASPYYIVDPHSQKRVVTIDTSGGITQVERGETPVLVTSDNLQIRDSSGEIRILPLQLDDGSYSQQQAQEFVHSWGSWFLLAFGGGVLVAVVMQSFLMLIIWAFFIGMICWCLAKILKVKLLFNQSMRLTAVAHTPAAIFFALLVFLQLDANVMLYLMSWAIDFGYLYFAIKSNKEW